MLTVIVTLMPAVMATYSNVLKHPNHSSTIILTVKTIIVDILIVMVIVIYIESCPQSWQHIRMY